MYCYTFFLNQLRAGVFEPRAIKLYVDELAYGFKAIGYQWYAPCNEIRRTLYFSKGTPMDLKPYGGTSR